MGDEESLLKWLQTFDLGKTPKNLSSLSDGVLLSAVLHSIDPGWFTETWLAKIKQDTGANWRLKVSNLKKIYDKVVDAYRENYGQRLSPQLLPDVNKIGEHEDAVEIQRLIKLVLGCAVMCERQTEYIRSILEMEPDHQHAIMCTIQELNLGSDNGAVGTGESLAPVTGSLAFSETAASRLQDELKLKQAMQELEAAIEQKEMLQQKCQRMDLQIQHLQEERTSLKARVAELQDKATSAGDNVEDQRCKELKRQLDTMQEEIFKLETSRDEYRVRTEMLERELNDLRVRQDELQGAANQARSLKDEVDILREAAGRLAKAEATVEGLRKKLEECSELRNQMKALEDKNTEYLHRNMELEEEVRKTSTWKNQLEVHRKQVTELQLKLNEETKHVDRLEYEGKRLQEKLTALSLEKERLLNERDKLREANEELELKLAYAKSNAPAGQLDMSSSTSSIPSPTEVLQIIPPDVKEKIIRLEHENKRLRENQFASSKLEEMQLTIDALRDREQELCSENRSVTVIEPCVTTKPVIAPCIVEDAFPVRRFHSEVSKSLSRLVEESKNLSIKRSHTSALISDELRCLELGYSLPTKNMDRRFSKPSTDSGCHSPYGTSKSGYGTSGVSSPCEEQLYETVSDRSWYIGVSSVDIPSIETDDDESLFLEKPLLPSVPQIADSESVSSEENDRSLSVIEISNLLKGYEPSTDSVVIPTKNTTLQHANSFSVPLSKTPDIGKVKSLPNLKLPVPPKQKRLPSYMKLEEIPFVDESEAHNPIEVVVITNEFQREFSEDSLIDPGSLNEPGFVKYDFSDGLELKPIPEINHYEEIPKREQASQSPTKSQPSSSQDIDDYDSSYNIRLVQSECDETSIYTTLNSRPQTSLGTRKRSKGKKKMKKALSATANFFFAICGP